MNDDRAVLTVLVKRLDHGSHLSLPEAATTGSAGLDLRAAVSAPEILAPGARRAVPTGIAVAIPPGWEGQVRPRSGLALAQGITLANSPGTIDSDYRGEVKVILINLGDRPFTLEPGMRIGQLLFSEVPPVALHEVDELPPSGRGEAGFGSSGTD